MNERGSQNLLGQGRRGGRGGTSRPRISTRPGWSCHTGGMRRKLRPIGGSKRKRTKGKRQRVERRIPRPELGDNGTFVRGFRGYSNATAAAPPNQWDRRAVLIERRRAEDRVMWRRLSNRTTIRSLWISTTPPGRHGPEVRLPSVSTSRRRATASLNTRAVATMSNHRQHQIQIPIETKLHWAKQLTWKKLGLP